MAELMPNNPLKLIPRQLDHGAPGDGNYRIRWAHSRGKRVNATLFIQYIEWRHGHIGGERNFLNDILRPAFKGVGGRRWQSSSTKRLCHGTTALGKSQPIKESYNPN